jgi:hypothetical protein
MRLAFIPEDMSSSLKPNPNPHYDFNPAGFLENGTKQIYLPKTKCKNANHNSTLFRFLKILLD